MKFLNVHTCQIYLSKVLANQAMCVSAIKGLVHRTANYDISDLIISSLETA